MFNVISSEFFYLTKKPDYPARTYIVEMVRVFIIE